MKHGKINATLPKDTDPKAVTLEQALELIAAKAAKGGTKKKAATKKPAAKKTAAKKTTARKSAEKTPAKATVDATSAEVPWDDVT